MGIGSKLGFGRKEPYKPPREIAVLRMKIEAESRENFPHLARYKELAREAEHVFRYLDAEIAKKKYAEEAGKLSEDIRNRLEALADRIQRNTAAAAKEGKADYMESTVDYLARKSVRNNAKTLFTEFLEGHELFLSTCRLSSPDCTGKLSTAASSMARSIEMLQEEYFSKHGGDEEIQGLRDRTREKVAELNAAFRLHKQGMTDRTAAEAAEEHLGRVLAASERMTGE